MSESRLPYPLKNDEIRLLKLLPGDWDDYIQCELSVINLTQSTKYTTLSYVWGDPKKLLPVEVNGFTVSITKNLFAALR